MFNIEYLKKLTVLFAEDEDLARMQLEKTLKRIFGEVLIAKNGLEALQIYQEKRIKKEKIDLIISDINMPQMSGIEMLEKVREVDKDIPFIFSTARSETEYLLKAIALHVDHYAIKPIDIDDMIKRIEKVCEKKYYEQILHEKSIELKEYLKLINSVATIFKMDSEGNITFVNNLFLELSGYKKDDILVKKFEDLISKQFDLKAIEAIWTTIKDDETWNGNIKYASKKDEIFYLKSTIFKVINENKLEYISIGFNSTDEINERREFHKKLLTNLKDKNIEVSQTTNKNKTLEQQVILLQNELAKEKQKQLDVNSQIKYYENEMLNVDERVIKNLKIKNSEIEKLKETLTLIKTDKEKFIRTISHLTDELNDAKNEIDVLYEKLKRKEKRVDDLNELLEMREAELKKYDPSYEK